MSPPLRGSALLLGLAIATGVACATVASRRAALSEREVIRFSHLKHHTAQIPCEACHARVAASTAVGEERLLPPEKTCLRCHAEWRQQGRCDACHLTSKPDTWPARERLVRFSHADHLTKVEGDCSRCHLELPEPGSTASTSTPMGACLSCHHHQQAYDQARCTPCHIDLSRLPLRPLAYFSHQGDYLKEHRLPGRTSPEACAQCHDQPYCLDCHTRTAPSPVELVMPERLDRQLIHRNDYLSRHAIEARADPAVCLRCHGTSSCDGCHRDSSISPSAGQPRDPHPRGWASARSAQFHGTAARRDIVSCAGCHDQGAASLCVGCHRVGGIGGSPHPPSFRNNHDREDIQRRASCRACHP
ncbi:MAG: hypothetical protein HY901_03490 [Deltaproteobacteria bacterium]|nr:hypothetical protein [Deltaproteobacteria bacterium]